MLIPKVPINSLKEHILSKIDYVLDGNGGGVYLAIEDFAATYSKLEDRRTTISTDRGVIHVGEVIFEPCSIAIDITKMDEDHPIYMGCGGIEKRPDPTTPEENTVNVDWDADRVAVLHTSNNELIIALYNFR